MLRNLVTPLVLVLATVLVATSSEGSARNSKKSAGPHRTTMFQGIKANTGYAIHATEYGRSILKVSDDFVIPDAPAPSWQVVDSKGNVYLLNQFNIKGGTNRQIVVPTYVKDIATVQVWCSYAEVLLGEASFDRPVR